MKRPSFRRGVFVCVMRALLFQPRRVEVQLGNRQALHASALVLHLLPELSGVANHDQRSVGRIVIGLRSRAGLFGRVVVKRV